MHWGFLFIWIIGAWLVWALLQDNRICFGSAQLSDEAFEEMPFRGIGIMDDDQRSNPCRPEWCRRLVLGQRRPSRTGIRPHESFPRPC